MKQLVSDCKICKDISCASTILSNNELDELGSSCRAISISKGETILHEGSFTSHVIYLRSGLIKETMKGLNNREQIFRILKGRTYLGMSSLFGDTINHFSYVALSDLELCHIEIGTFKKLLLANAKFTYEIMTSQCKENLNNYDKLLKQGQKKIFGRLADALLFFSEDIFKSKKFVLPLTQQEIANFIGTSRESTTKGLSNLKRNKIIAIDNSTVEIIDLERLKQVSKTG